MDDETIQLEAIGSLWNGLYLGVLGLHPLEEDPEPDVVGVRGELPVQTLAVLVGRHSDRYGLTMTNLQYLFIFKTKSVMKQNEIQTF